VPSAVAPSDLAQTSQALVHAAPQQKPSWAKPLAQAEEFVAGWPVLSRHAPEALHDFVPVQVSGSSALVTGVHAPVPLAHVSQTPPLPQAVAQQILSLQMPEAQSLSVVHVAPFAARAKSSALGKGAP
jgi:hypothetical protein